MKDVRPLLSFIFPAELWRFPTHISEIAEMEENTLLTNVYSWLIKTEVLTNTHAVLLMVQT